MSDTKTITATIDEIVEAVMHLKPVYNNPTKKEWADHIRTALERFVVGEEEHNYTAHFLEWRDKYWKRKLKILEWKSKSKHLTTSELHDFYNQAFHHTPKKGGEDEG